MSVFFVYTVKWALCVSLLYSGWSLLLRRETFHRMNRIFLVSFIVIGAVLPLIEFKAPTDLPMAGIMSSDSHFFVFRNNLPSVQAKPTVAPFWSTLLLLIYIIGVVYSLLRYTFDLLAVVRLIRRSQLAEIRNGIHICLDEQIESPVSWMRWVVISPKDLLSNGSTFLAHETTHIRNGHSLELLLTEICVRLQWYNPFAWMLRNDLQTVQEFEADQAALQNGMNCEGYAHLLITKAVNPQLAAANSFLRSPLKARISMMLRPTSSQTRIGRILFTVPVCAFALFVFAKPNMAIAVAKIKTLEELPTIISSAKFSKSEQTDIKETSVSSDTLITKMQTKIIPTYDEENTKELPPLTSEYILSLMKGVNGSGVILTNDSGNPLSSNGLEFMIDEHKVSKDAFLQYAEWHDLDDPRVGVFTLRKGHEAKAIGYTPANIIRHIRPDISATEGVVQIWTTEAESGTFRSKISETLKTEQADIQPYIIKYFEATDTIPQ